MIFTLAFFHGRGYLNSMKLYGGAVLNSKQLKLVMQLAKTRSFSQAAEKLGISQPALSKQIQNLEKELGLRLFQRDSIPLSLTPAGEQFVTYAQEVLYKEDQLLRTIERFRSGEAGRLDIGISPFRSLYLMPRIIRKFQAKYPGVQVCLHELVSDLLRQGAADGKFDFAIINLPVDESVLEITPIEPDKLVLAVPNSMLHLLPNQPDAAFAELDFADCQALPFITVGQLQEMRQLFEHLCAKAQIHPQITAEVVGVTTAWAMVHAGIGATILPLQFIDSDSFDNNVKLFFIKDNTFVRQPAIVTRRGQYLPEYAKYAISLLTGAVK